jgi:hypothetical protein
MSPTVKKITNTDSAFPYRFADANSLGNSITVETAEGLTKRQLLAALCVPWVILEVEDPRKAVKKAFELADAILAGPDSDEDLVDLDSLGKADPCV